MTKVLYITFILVFILTGCSKKEVFVPVVKVKHHFIPDELLLDDINITVPPDRDTVINASPIEREILFRDMIINLYKDIGKYKVRIKTISVYTKYIKEKINMADSK